VSPVRRYHPLLVGLHWLMALLVIATLALGALKMAPLANTDPMKIEALRAHMAGGVAILVLLAGRFITRQTTARPAPQSAGLEAFDRIRPLAHALLYLLILGMTLSGLTMALQAGLFDIIYGGRGRLPPSLWIYPIRSVHFWISRGLMLVIGLHLSAVGYHQFVLRDGLIRRMWFGRRRARVATDLAGPDPQSSGRPRASAARG